MISGKRKSGQSHKYSQTPSLLTMKVKRLLLFWRILNLLHRLHKKSLKWQQPNITRGILWLLILQVKL